MIPRQFEEKLHRSPNGTLSYFNESQTAMQDFISLILYRQSALVRVSVVLIGAVLIHLTIGTYHTFGNMLPYMASYMRNYTDPSVRVEHLMWIPTFQGCFPFAMVIGGAINLRLGPRLTTFIGCSLATSSVALSSLAIKHSFVLFFMCYGLMYGLGMGIAYVTAVATVINWAPDKVGVVSGIVAAGFGLSSSIFAPIQTTFVNPTNLPSTKDGYFLQKELLERVPDVFIHLAWVYGSLQAFALIVICDPPEKILASGLGSVSDILTSFRTGVKETRYTGVRYKPVRMADEIMIERNENGQRRRSRSQSRESCSGSDSEDEVFQDDILGLRNDRSMSPAEMLRSPTFLFLFGALFCCSFYANMFYNLYKTYGETFIEDDFFLANAFSIGSVVNAVARVSWGYITDKTNFQFAVSTATCIASIFLFTMPLVHSLGKFFYLIWLCGIFACMGATHALFITATVKCFGSKYKASNYGFLTFSTTLSGILLALVSQYYLPYIGYTWMFIVTAIFPFIAFLITSSIQGTPQGKYITQ
ncbi:unnamed protein product [Auanema sp. JU1783]|nr:unnamed protein product [Auanema sp. JU1783]